MPIQPVSWSVSDKGLTTATYWSCRKFQFSIDRSQMNTRDVSESLDDKIMGDIATVAVWSFLVSLGIDAVAYDHIRNDNFKQPDPGWDLAIGTGASEWGKTTEDPRIPVGLQTASVKSSRLPRTDTIEQALRMRDFKIFAPQGKTISDCIGTDIEMQVYYPYSSSQLGNLQITGQDIAKCIQKHGECSLIVNQLKLRQRYGSPLLAAWNYKAAIEQHHRELAEHYWYSFGKRMWFAPLRFGRDFQELGELNENL